MLMTKGMPFCSATCAMAVLCAGIEGADQELRALADQLLGARARDIDVGFGVGVHDLQRRQAEVLEDARRDIDAALAVLADAGLR